MVNGERSGKRLLLLLKCSERAADSSAGFIRIVSLTIMVPIPRYRLAVGRQVAEECEDQDLEREVTRAAMD